ncbi:MAG: hypothetical protein ACKPKO_13415, partial [Candidatus Fonsibacter sp.]
TEVDTELAKKVNQTYSEASYYTKSQTYTKLDTKQNLITTSSTLTLSTLVAPPTIRTTNIEFSDVASSGATLLSIKSGTTTVMSMAPTISIKHFTYSDFNSNYLYNTKEVNGLDNILGSGIFAATRGSFTYLQASGSSYLRPISPLVQGTYSGQASTTSSGVKMVASGETTIDFSTLEINYKRRIQYNNTTNALSFFSPTLLLQLIGSDRPDDG